MSNHNIGDLNDTIASEFDGQIRNTDIGEDSETLVLEFRSNDVTKDDLLTSLSRLRDDEYKNLGFVVKEENEETKAAIRIVADSPQEHCQYVSHKLGIDDEELVNRLSMVAGGVKSESNFDYEDLQIVLGVFAQSENIPVDNIYQIFDLSCGKENFKRNIEKIKEFASPDNQETGGDGNQSNSAFDW